LGGDDSGWPAQGRNSIAPVIDRRYQEDLEGAQSPAINWKTLDSMKNWNRFGSRSYDLTACPMISSARSTGTARL
jgi:hypothetical protein